VIEEVRAELLIISRDHRARRATSKPDASAAQVCCKEQTLPLPRSAVASDKHFAH
jgi:hypothetical protein